MCKNITPGHVMLDYQLFNMPISLKSKNAVHFLHLKNNNVNLGFPIY